MAQVAYLSLLMALAAPAPAPTIVTTAPLDTITRCLRDRMSPGGRVTAINTAGGTMLDFAFETVGADGKVGTSRLSFTIEDRGTERTLTAGAPNPADVPLASQYLKQAGTRCVAEAEAKPEAQGAP